MLFQILDGRQIRIGPDKLGENAVVEIEQTQNSGLIQLRTRLSGSFIERVVEIRPVDESTLHNLVQLPH